MYSQGWRSWWIEAWSLWLSKPKPTSYNLHYTVFFCTGCPLQRGKHFLSNILFLHLDEYKCTVKWYNACLTVPFNGKGQNLHNSQLKGSQQGWHYKLSPLNVPLRCSALLSVYPGLLFVESRPFLAVRYSLNIFYLFFPLVPLTVNQWATQAKLEEEMGCVSLKPWGYSVMIYSFLSSYTICSSLLTGTGQTPFRLNNGFSIISSNDMVKR